jgi:hypothetical protein
MLMNVGSASVRWLAIYLPRLSTDRLIRSGRAPADDRPLATYTKEAGAFQLTGVDARASKLGLRLAMSLADARAIQPKLEAVEAEPEEDARTLDNIAAWCERFTPIVVLDPPEGLFLDITGCGHLFGGEEALRKLIVTRLQAQGFTARAAIADTPGAAWALVRYKQPKRAEKTLRAALEASLSEESLSATLAPLPIEALRLNPDAVALIRRSYAFHSKIKRAPAGPPRLRVSSMSNAGSPSSSSGASLGAYATRQRVHAALASPRGRTSKQREPLRSANSNSRRVALRSSGLPRPPSAQITTAPRALKACSAAHITSSRLAARTTISLERSSPNCASPSG